MANGGQAAAVRRSGGDDVQGRVRKAVYLAPEIWDWLDEVAAHADTSRSDLLEGIVLMAMDEEEMDGPWRPVVTVDVKAGVL